MEDPVKLVNLKRLFVIAGVLFLASSCSDGSPTTDSGSTESVDVDRTCRTFIDRSKLIMESFGDNGHSANLLGLVGAPTEIASMFEAMALTAPRDVSSDLVAAAEALRAAEAGSGKLEDLLAAVAGGLPQAAGVARINEWVSSNCDISGLAVSTSTSFVPDGAVELLRDDDISCSNYVTSTARADHRLFVDLRWDHPLIGLSYVVEVAGVTMQSGQEKGPDIDGSGGVIQLTIDLRSGDDFRIAWEPLGGRDSLIVLGDCQAKVAVWGSE